MFKLPTVFDWIEEACDGDAYTKQKEEKLGRSMRHGVSISFTLEELENIMETKND